jgi:hypothetical protein
MGNWPASSPAGIWTWTLKLKRGRSRPDPQHLHALLDKNRHLQPGLPIQLYSLMRNTIIVPAAHYVCSTVCNIFVVTVRESLAGKGRGQGGMATALITIAEPESQGSRSLARLSSSGSASPAWRASPARAAWSP